MRNAIGIDGREYKLLLDPRRFAGAPSSKVASDFWNRQLKPIIEKRLARKDDGASRAEGELSLKKKRVVTFLDTKKGLLAKHGFALRSRTAIENGAPVGDTEVTLKFRSPDFLIAAEYCRAARANGGADDTKLEEDIGPLQVPRGKKSLAVAVPRSIYSRFAVSTKIKINAAIETVSDVFSRFGALEKSLSRNSDGEDNGAARLRSGPTICEWVFQEAAVDLGDKLNAEFAFTLWYFSEGGTLKNFHRRTMSGAVDPRIAEISFDFETQAGRLDTEAAKRAITLFISMQEKLPVDVQIASKTALGLPSYLTEPNGFRRFVESRIREKEKSLEVHFSQGSIDVISEPDDSIETYTYIDPTTLRKTLDPIIDDAASRAAERGGVGVEVRKDDIRKALDRRSCHYLWFC